MAKTYKAPVTWISYEEKYGNYACRLKGEDGFFKSSNPWPDGVRKGATIELVARPDDRGGFEVKPGSVKVLKAPGGGGKGGYRGGGGGKGGYNDPERQAKITWQHSQEMAIAAATVLLENDGYKLGAKNKPQERYEQILGLIDDLTVKFFEDVDTRKPQKAADEVRKEVSDAEDTGEEDWEDSSDASEDWSDDDVSSVDDDDWE